MFLTCTRHGGWRGVAGGVVQPSVQPAGLGAVRGCTLSHHSGQKGLLALIQT